MTYNLARIEAAVRAVAPEAVIYSNAISVGVQFNRWSGMSVYVDGRMAIDSAVLSPQDRAIVRAVLDDLDAQDAARGEGER